MLFVCFIDRKGKKCYNNTDMSVLKQSRTFGKEQVATRDHKRKKGKGLCRKTSREKTMNQIHQVKRFYNFREMLCDSAEKFDKKPAFRRKLADGTLEDISYSSLLERYYRLCSFMLDEGLGGKRIAVIGKNCYEWALCYLCAATVGVVVPLDKELSDEDIANFLEAADCSAICTDGKKPSVPDEKRLTWKFEDLSDLATGGRYTLGQYVGAAYPVNREAVNAIEFPRDKMQILIFTSGTTGSSKGVCLSQFNICSNVFSGNSVIKVTSADLVLSVLPLHHTYECSLDCLLTLSRGVCITYADSLGRVSANIREYSPTALVVVPELLRFVAKKIKKSVIDGCPERYKHFFEENEFADAMAKLPFVIRLAIRKKVKAALGGRLRMFLVGAAELDTSIVYDFAALGIKTLQGYGLTECSPLLACNNDFYLNAASTGLAVPGVSLKIHNPNEDGIGEILAKGDNIMLGYYNDPQATAAVFHDGWFCTGDLGKLGKDGELYITGRLKNVIVTENGKNIYPEELESRLSVYPEIAEVLVLAAKNHDRVCVKAKIYPNHEYLKETLGHAPDSQEAEAIVRGAVEDMNAQVPSYKHITVVEVLSEPLEKTTTRKIRRVGDNVK